MRFTPAQLEAAADAVAEYMSVEVRPAYSGRGMYGKTCLGVVVSRTAAAGMFVVALAEQVGEPPLDMFAEFAELERTDNMGYDTIVYWPSVRVL